MADSETAQRVQWNEQVIEEFRANDGRVGGPFEGVPILLLHSRGAKTGEPRINPVAYLEEDGRLYVFASNGGREANPGWYYNVLAAPDVVVEVGTRTAAAVATPLTGAERDRVYAVQSSLFPAFRDYEEKVERVIPVVALELTS